MGRSAMMNDMSTMDPAFWFHHSFVDCQLAMHRQAFPQGEYMPDIKAPEESQDYYPDEDPVPANDDRRPTDSRAWLHSNMHPWTYGLFQDLDLFAGGLTLEEERKKVRSDFMDPDIHYVQSADVEDPVAWGYTCAMLLKQDVVESGVVSLSGKDRSTWQMTAKDSLEAFVFDLSTDPFVEAIRQGWAPPYNMPKALPWKTEDIPDALLARLKAAATTQRWTLAMKLPRFFKMDDGGAVGRSYTVNVFVAATDAELAQLKANPVLPSPAFAGSAAVFSPFNLRQCLNCQTGHVTVWPVTVDLTDLIITRQLTRWTKAQIEANLVLEPVGIPRGFFTPSPDYRTLFDAHVVIDEAPVPTSGPGTIPVVLYEWRASLSKAFRAAALAIAPAVGPGLLGTYAANTGALGQPQAVDDRAVFAKWSKKWKNQGGGRMNDVMKLLDDRVKPVHRFSLA